MEKYMSFFFFNDTATTEIYTLSLHDALPIYLSAWNKNSANFPVSRSRPVPLFGTPRAAHGYLLRPEESVFVTHEAMRRYERDRKSTRLNSSHANISYAVFCLKKKRSRLPVLY